MLTPVLFLTLAAAQEAGGPPVIQETVAVERVMVDARVLHRGRAVRGLGPENFRVRIDGGPAELLSVTWISSEGAETRAETGSRNDTTVAEEDFSPVRGRLVVLFFQKELHPSRTGGFMLLLKEASRLISRFGPRDRVAILSFDTHLKLWRDFTADKESLYQALETDLIFRERPRYIEAGPDPSLSAWLGLEESREAASPETALRLIGEVLYEIEGSKTLVFIGHGMGELSGPRVSLHDDYGAARQVLLEAGVTVFSLDVTDADHHTLEVGLQDIAAETGGFYARAHNFSGQAVSRLEQALEGHYVLEVGHPGGERGRHDIDVDVVESPGQVLARKSYFN